MKHSRKRLILTAVLTLCVALFACVFAACDNTPKVQAVTYSVTVQTDATTPAEGVSVKVNKGGALFGDPKTTNNQGKVFFELVPDDYTISLSSLPAHYHVPDNASLALSTTVKELTVTLEKNFGYTVKLVKADGTPYYADGVTVGICTAEGNCLTPVALEKDGTAIIDATPGEYHVKLFDLPATALVETDEDDYYAGESFTAESNEMTITVNEAAAIQTTTAMTAAEIEEYKQTNFMFDDRYVSYKFEKEVAAGTTEDIVFTPEITGNYYFFTDSDLSYVKVGETGGYFSYIQSLEAGKTLYIKATNKTAETKTAKIVVSVPYSTHIEHKGQGGVIDVVVGKKDTQAIIAFTPTVGGMYKLTVQGDTKAVVDNPSYVYDEFIADIPVPEAFVSSASVTAAVTTKSAKNGIVLYFTVAVKADKYPAKATVKIEKTADCKDSRTDVEVTETLTQFTKPENKELYGIPMDGTAELVKKDGKFYYKDKLVVVRITTPLDRDRFANEATLAYMDMIDGRLATYDIDTVDGCNTSTVSYANFIRGFSEYEYDKIGNPVIPEKITVQTYYAKDVYVNEDGVYPLTQELYDFLHAFYEVNKEAFEWQIPMDADLESGWLFPCYYYDEVIVADAIVGEYKFVECVTQYGDEYKVGGTKNDWDENWNVIQVPVTDEEYKLVIDKKGTFTIYDIDDSPVIEGNWTKSEAGVYTFTQPNGDWDDELSIYKNLEYTFTIDENAGTVKLENAEKQTYWVFKLPAKA